MSLESEPLKLLLPSVVIGLWLYWLWTRRRWYRFALSFPGQIGLPLFGNLYKFRKWQNVVFMISKLFVDCKNHTVCIWMGLSPYIISADPEFAAQVLSSPDLLNKSKTLYSSLDNLFDSGIGVSAADKWKPHRKLLNPVFSHKVLMSLIPNFNKTKNFAIAECTGFVDGEDHKLHNVIKRFVAGITVATIMGKETQEVEEVIDDITAKFDSLMVDTTANVRYKVAKLSWAFHILYKRFFETKQTVYAYLEELVNAKLNQPKSAPSRIKCSDLIQSDEDVPEIGKSPKIFIDQVLEAYNRQQISWHELLGNSCTLFLTSFETSSNSIFSTLVLLAMHTTVQERLFEEIINFFPEKNFEMTHEHLDSLPYLEMVINETLRLTPPAAMVGRHVVKDTPLGGHELPAGLQIVISIFDLHRRKDIWGPDADKFNPDHFLPENLAGKHSHAFIPFLKGVRNCIGWRYAMISMKILLAGLVRHFRFTTNFKFEDIRFVNYISLRYEVEPKLKIFLRE